MNNDVIIDCPYCETRIFIKKFKKIRSLIYCYNCEEPIIPKIYFLYEFFYFLFNAFIFALIIAISAYSFENYSEWKNISGFVFLTSLMIASLALHEFFHAFFAYIFGDYSVFSKGYLRLNIFKYIHGIHSIIMPLAFLFIVGILFPELTISNKIKKMGASILEEESKRLIFKDGAFAQNSSNYHRLMLMDYLYAIQLARINSYKFSNLLYQQINKAYLFLFKLIDSIFVNVGRSFTALTVILIIPSLESPFSLFGLLTLYLISSVPLKFKSGVYAAVHWANGPES